MKSTITDWMTCTISVGVPVSACIRTAPARSAPNRIPASTVPPGLARPSSATVIASKPMLASTSPVSAALLPPSDLR